VHVKNNGFKLNLDKEAERFQHSPIPPPAHKYNFDFSPIYLGIFFGKIGMENLTNNLV